MRMRMYTINDYTNFNKHESHQQTSLENKITIDNPYKKTLEKIQAWYFIEGDVFVPLEGGSGIFNLKDPKITDKINHIANIAKVPFVFFKSISPYKFRDLVYSIDLEKIEIILKYTSIQDFLLLENSDYENLIFANTKNLESKLQLLASFPNTTVKQACDLLSAFEIQDDDLIHKIQLLCDKKNVSLHTFLSKHFDLNPQDRTILSEYIPLSKMSNYKETVNSLSVSEICENEWDEIAQLVADWKSIINEKCNSIYQLGSNITDELNKDINILKSSKNLFKISLKEYKVYFQQSIGDNLDSFLSKQYQSRTI